MAFFHVIIPTIGRAELDNAIKSVTDQTFKDWHLTVVFDNCSNNSLETIDKQIDYVYAKDHNGAGGCRNLAMTWGPSEYTLFLDDDDIFATDTVFQELCDFIIGNHKPDIVRLGYIKHFIASGIKKTRLINPNESRISEATLSSVVGAPTKAIKTCKLVEFPPIVKHQDVVQHISQCDKCETVEVFDKPFFIYNIYDRPDKAKYSKESQHALEVIPYTLRGNLYQHGYSHIAALRWANKIEAMYG